MKKYFIKIAKEKMPSPSERVKTLANVSLSVTNAIEYAIDIKSKIPRKHMNELWKRHP